MERCGVFRKEWGVCVLEAEEGRRRSAGTRGLTLAEGATEAIGPEIRGSPF